MQENQSHEPPSSDHRGLYFGLLLGALVGHYLGAVMLKSNVSIPAGLLTTVGPVIFGALWIAAGSLVGILLFEVMPRVLTPQHVEVETRDPRDQ
jgi:hypothetical protein